jgi:hypothetical protein
MIVLIAISEDSRKIQRPVKDFQKGLMEIFAYVAGTLPTAINQLKTKEG